MLQGTAHPGVGVERDLAAGVVDQAGGQRQRQFAALGLGQDPAAQPGTDQVELCLTAEQIISVVTVETSDRLAAAAVALAVVSEALGRPAVSPVLKRTVVAEMVRWLEQLPFPCAKLPTSSA